MQDIFIITWILVWLAVLHKYVSTAGGGPTRMSGSCDLWDWGKYSIRTIKGRGNGIFKDKRVQ